MDRDLVLGAHACVTHIGGRVKTIQCLMERRFTNTPINDRMWRRDLDKSIEEITEELTALKEIRDQIYTKLDD